MRSDIHYLFNRSILLAFLEDPSEYNPKNVLLFLQHNQDYSSTQIYTLRSSLASVFSVAHNDCLPVADQPIFKYFFAAKRNSEVKISTEQQLRTWDISILVDYIRTQLSPTDTLTLEQLKLKTILLISIAIVWKTIVSRYYFEKE